MAGRPPKKKLEYAGWSVDIFDNDTKIDKLLDAQGAIGFTIYFYLCQKAYGSDGYFYKWCYDDCATTARKLGGGVGAGTVKETVGYCLQIGLFDKGLFDRWKILSSKGIQSRYWSVASERRDKTVIKEFWLLEKSESDGVIFAPQNSNYEPTNSNYEPTNSNYEPTNSNYERVKESKVKESKVKERKEATETVCYFPNDEKLNQTFLDYMKMRKEIKKPMTERAIELAIGRLNKLATLPFSDSIDNDLAIQILEQSILGGWQGLFELKEQRNRKQGKSDYVDKWRNV